ncbi:Uncharacterised protein [Mycobacteroides abscessus subsp. abscessus]|nr:Uncharacterised protein [Mycobacteroides abscessus subsp. abscessus]
MGARGGVRAASQEGRQGAGQGQPPLLARTQRRRGHPGQAQQAQPLQGRPHPGHRQGSPVPVLLPRQGSDALAGREPLPGPRRLGVQGRLRRGGLGQEAGILPDPRHRAAHPHRSGHRGPRGQQPGGRAQQGGLARPGGTHQRGDLPGPGGHLDVVHGGLGAPGVGHAQPLDGQDRATRRCARRVPRRSIGRVPRLLLPGRRRVLPEDLLGPTQGRDPVLGLVVGGADVAQGLEAFGGQQQHQQPGVQPQAPVDQAHPDGHGHHRHGQRGDQLQGQGGEEGRAQGGHGGAPVTLPQLGQSAPLRPIPVQPHQHGQAPGQLRQVRGQPQQPGLGGAGVPLGGLADQHHEHRHQRQGQHQHERADRIDQRHHAQQDHGDDAGGHQGGHGPGVVVVQGVQSPGDQHGRPARAEVPAEQLAAQQPLAQLGLGAAGRAPGGNTQQPVTRRPQRQAADRDRQGRAQTLRGESAGRPGPAEPGQQGVIAQDLCADVLGQGPGGAGIRQAGQPRLGQSGQQHGQAQAEQHRADRAHRLQEPQCGQGPASVRPQRGPRGRPTPGLGLGGRTGGGLGGEVGIGAGVDAGAGRAHQRLRRCGSGARPAPARRGRPGCARCAGACGTPSRTSPGTGTARAGRSSPRWS